MTTPADRTALIRAEHAARRAELSAGTVQPDEDYQVPTAPPEILAAARAGDRQALIRWHHQQRLLGN